MLLSADALLIAATRSGRPQTASSAVFIAIILLAVLYIAWRAGWVRNQTSGSRLLAWRADLRDLHVSPLALIPTLILVVVIILLVAH